MSGAAEVTQDRAEPVVDLSEALELARQAHQIIAEQDREASQEIELDRDDLMRRREADALADAAARQNAVRQEPAPSRRAERARRAELEMEAGQ